MFHFAKAVVAVLVLTAACAAQAQDRRDGVFVFSASTDPFTDDDRSFVFTTSTDFNGRNAALSWRCLDDGMNVIYHHDKYLGGDEDDEVLVRYRIDSLAAYGPSYWAMMQGHESTWMPMAEIAAFTRQARNGSSVIFEVVDPLDGERLRDSFRLHGLEQALARLSCAN